MNRNIKWLASIIAGLLVVSIVLAGCGNSNSNAPLKVFIWHLQTSQLLFELVFTRIHLRQNYLYEKCIISQLFFHRAPLIVQLRLDLIRTCAKERMNQTNCLVCCLFGMEIQEKSDQLFSMQLIFLFFSSHQASHYFRIQFRSPG